MKLPEWNDGLFYWKLWILQGKFDAQREDLSGWTPNIGARVTVRFDREMNTMWFCHRNPLKPIEKWWVWGDQARLADEQDWQVCLFTVKTMGLRAINHGFCTTNHGIIDVLKMMDFPRLRFSCDIRWQPSSHAVDPRYTATGRLWNDEFVLRMMNFVFQMMNWM